MKLLAWRVILKNPCEDPPVKVVISPEAGPSTGLYGWVIPLEAAIAIFGKDDVDKIIESPREVFLTMTLANPNEP